MWFEWFLSLQDQEKMTTQQKSLKEQEQERQWKQLQAMRAKEQQLQQFTTQGKNSVWKFIPTLITIRGCNKSGPLESMCNWMAGIVNIEFSVN